ncbi:O-antigen ligase family protein [Clostridium saudiense]|uniref:O-antigen ligase family protein n=1 Tax=Clostridium saudiense TaxID=1414720 RepID=A0ABS2FCS7_9CLOT|nr:O-antigen ligase family protein [Clostridium saudiense]MBM6818116.1 O-antigen ligase family protein [Clostridium saudiense]
MTVFVGINGNPHGNSYVMILMAIVIEIIISKKDNRYLALYFIPLLSAFMSGARTPAVVMLGIFLGIRCFKNRIRTNLRFSWKGLLIVVGFLIVISIFSDVLVNFALHSNIMDKFSSTSDSGNVLNSRDLIWNGLINEFKYNFSDIERVFGHGIHYSVIINMYNVNSPIWGHSDFIDILISYGIIMLAIYVVMYVRYFIKLWSIGGNALLIMVFFVGMVLLSIFNGVINYTVFISAIAFWAMFYISIEDKDINEGEGYE